MSRSKEMGKPVADLSADDLRRERTRCQTLIKIAGTSTAAKLIRKRLHQIDGRIGGLDVDQAR